MFRKITLGLLAAASIGATALLPTAASAHPMGWGWGWGGGWYPGYLGPSVVLSTPRGVFTVSENGVAPDSYNPRASKIPGLREAAERDDWECIINGNAIESLVEQYTSMVKEKSVADVNRKNADFFNTYQSSQMIASTVAPGIEPAYEQDELDFGEWTN